MGRGRLRSCKHASTLVRLVDGVTSQNMWRKKLAKQQTNSCLTEVIWWRLRALVLRPSALRWHHGAPGLHNITLFGIFSSVPLAGAWYYPIGAIYKIQDHGHWTVVGGCKHWHCNPLPWDEQGKRENKKRRVSMCGLMTSRSKRNIFYFINIVKYGGEEQHSHLHWCFWMDS